MGQNPNLAKPYILLWGKVITWPSHIFIKVAVVDDVVDCYNLVCCLFVSACYNQGLHSLIYRDTGQPGNLAIY